MIIDVSKEVRDILISKNYIWGGTIVRFKIISHGVTSARALDTRQNTVGAVQMSGHCFFSGHSYKECPNKEKSATCSNCKRLGRNSDHVPKCPAYISSLNRLILRTDYGV